MLVCVAGIRAGEKRLGYIPVYGIDSGFSAFHLKRYVHIVPRVGYCSHPVGVYGGFDYTAVEDELKPVIIIGSDEAVISAVFPAESVFADAHLFSEDFDLPVCFCGSVLAENDAAFTGCQKRDGFCPVPFAEDSLFHALT